MTFDPSDHVGGPREAPHAPGGEPPLCRGCGGDAWYYFDPESEYGDPVSCRRCGGTGVEPKLSPELVWVLVLSAAITFWALVGAALYLWNRAR